MKGYRTLILNGVATVAPILDQIISTTPIAGPKTAAVISSLGAFNMFLRFLTTTPVFNKE